MNVKNLAFAIVGILKDIDGHWRQYDGKTSHKKRLGSFFLGLIFVRVFFVTKIFGFLPHPLCVGNNFAVLG